MRCIPAVALSVLSAWLLNSWIRNTEVNCFSHRMVDNYTGPHERHKRNLPLVFPQGGISKLILGFAIPVKNPININLIFALNFQYQYAVPPNISFFTQYYPFVDEARRKRSPEGDDRNIFYTAAESTMDGFGINGRECMLRTICEAAEAPVHHNGLIGELLHLLLTPPNKGLVDSIGDIESSGPEDDYSAASKAGEQLYDCRELYPRCPVGHGLFDVISFFM